MSQSVLTLTTSQAGMTRLRDKGGASEKALYELTNGYVAASGSPTQRPGTTWKFNWADPFLSKGGNAGKMKGLSFFNGVFYRFSASALQSGNSTYQIITLVHPTSSAATLQKVHFVQPFMGYLYVVAQFSATTDYPNGYIGHYWLQNPAAWKGNKVYMPGDLVQPTTPNGFYYKAVAQINPPAWTPLLQHNLADVIQPTVANGYYYWASTLSAGSGATTTATNSPTIPAVGGSFTVNVASTTGFNTTANNVIGFSNGVTCAFQGTVTSVGAGSLTVTVTNIFFKTAATVSIGTIVSQQIDRSGATEPVWATTPAAITLDVSAATQPPVSAPSPTLPPPSAPNTGPGGKYNNPATPTKIN